MGLNVSCDLPFSGIMHRIGKFTSAILVACGWLHVCPAALRQTAEPVIVVNGPTTPVFTVGPQQAVVGVRLPDPEWPGESLRRRRGASPPLKQPNSLWPRDWPHHPVKRAASQPPGGPYGIPVS